jgi:ABC-2 type transport system ATP-binding protein
VTPAVHIEGLRKAYGAIRAVDGVDLSVDEGEIFGILGPNGSGKTTTVGRAGSGDQTASGRARRDDHGPRPERSP